MLKLQANLMLSNQEYKAINGLIEKRENPFDYLHKSIVDETIGLNDDYAFTLKIKVNAETDYLETIITIHYGDKDLIEEKYTNEFKDEFIFSIENGDIEVKISIMIES